jgi:hypothetical protein
MGDNNWQSLAGEDDCFGKMRGIFTRKDGKMIGIWWHYPHAADPERRFLLKNVWEDERRSEQVTWGRTMTEVRRAAETARQEAGVQPGGGS